MPNRVISILTLVSSMSVMVSNSAERAFVDKDFFIVKDDPVGSGVASKIYLIPFNGVSTSEAQEIVIDAGSDGGIVYNNETQSVVWVDSEVVKSYSLVNQSESTVVDLVSCIKNCRSCGDTNSTNKQYSTYDETDPDRTSHVIARDLAMDTLTGDIFYAGRKRNRYVREIIGIIEPSGTAKVYRYLAPAVPVGIAIDSKKRSLFYAVTYPKGSSDSRINWIDVDGYNMTPIVRNLGDVYGLAVDNEERRLYWTDGNTIYRSAYDGNSNASFYTDKGADIRDIKVVGNYLYYIGLNKNYITRVHKHTSSDANVGPNGGLSRMRWFDVYVSPDHPTDETTPDKMHILLFIAIPTSLVVFVLGIWICRRIVRRYKTDGCLCYPASVGENRPITTSTDNVSNNTANESVYEEMGYVEDIEQRQNSHAPGNDSSENADSQDESYGYISVQYVLGYSNSAFRWATIKCI